MFATDKVCALCAEKFVLHACQTLDMCLYLFNIFCIFRKFFQYPRIT